ncbi:universal stress protein [Pengzhenrongella frigida]|uniref:Universal stress protein n=1 Tax=Pengzhenrongella frigida TaxID=1259133 RepID=A0A4Q5N3G6_9MICO|nr:universal stress protein [Cellulomonas sp. HLT2-17]RYV52696.1 universal stress protein [Cellulomonas sp. HLT2-17]
MRVDGPLVIALDGSLHSAQTVHWGLTEAVLRDAPVLLTRVYREPRELLEWSWYPLLGEDLGLDTEVQQYLAEQLERARARFPALTIDVRVLSGPEVPELRRLSEDAQLLVIGARGHAGRRRVGSVSGHLAAQGRCPVAVVRGPDDESRLHAAPVVVGVDGSQSSLTAAHTAAREASLRAVPLVVVHARPTIANPNGRGMPALPPLAAGRVDENDPTHRAAQDMAAVLRAMYPTLDVRLELLDDDPVHALVAASRDAQLVVVGSRGLGAFRGMLLGAVSNEVVRDAESTVLVLHDAGPRSP